jgi:hypothetical protein
VVPTHRHFEDVKAERAGDGEYFDVEAPTIDAATGEDCIRRLGGEELEAALGVVDPGNTVR